jgi:hypothetical protein
MGLLGDEAQVEARFGPLEIVLLLMHDWCTVCVKRTVGLEIVLEAPMELLVDVGLVESRYNLF